MKKFQHASYINAFLGTVLFLTSPLSFIQAQPGKHNGEEEASKITPPPKRQGKIPKNMKLDYEEIKPEDDNCPVDIKPGYTQHYDERRGMYYYEEDNTHKPKPSGWIWAQLQKYIPSLGNTTNK